MRRLVLLFIIVAVMPSGAKAESFKWGVVDVDQVLEGYEFVETAFRRLEQDYEREQRILDARAEEINQLDKDLRVKKDLASDEAKEELNSKEESLKEQTLEYFRRGREMSDRLEGKKGLHIQRILERVGEAIDELAKKENYDIIFKKKFLAYVNEDPQYDVTQKVVDLLNSKPAPDFSKIDEEFEAMLQKQKQRLGGEGGLDLNKIESAPQQDY